jgi:hypothetical protein
MSTEINDLKNLLLNRNPILFTGAGFSKFATMKNGKPIVDGNGLKEILIADLLKYKRKSNEFTELMNSSLSDVCHYVSQERTNKHLEDFLVHVFSSCLPASFHACFTKYKWKKIYTVNIDDILENTFDPNTIIVQNRNHPNLLESSGKIEYIKLHGCVRNPSGGFVFSSSDYVDSMLKSRDYRFNQFGQDIQFGDFIFIGAEYNEINLDFYLKLYEEGGTASSKGRLFFINPYPSIIFKSKIKSIGGTIIEWTTEKFAYFLETEIINTTSHIHKINIDGYLHFNDKVDEYTHTKEYRSDLYKGFNPKWMDIIFDWDFINERVLDAFDTYKSYIESYKIHHSLFALVGKSMSGKSIYLKRLGYILHEEGYDVYEFVSRRFDYYTFIKYVRNQNHNKYCLLMDNASYYYGSLKTLIRAFPKDKELIIITTSRPFFHNRKIYSLITEDFHEHYIETDISKSYSIEIENKLERKGFIGELKNLSKNERIEKISGGNDIASVLFSITYGKGFHQRFQKNIHDNFNKLGFGKDILINLAIFYKLDLPYLPIEIITLILQSNSKKSFNEIEDFTKYNQQNGIELRNNFLVDYILKQTTNKSLINYIKEILITISPQVTEEMSSYWNEIQATLMKEKLLRNRLSLTTKNIKNLLVEIQSYYNDNYNYWLQLGIAEQHEYEYENALNHFKQAEALSPNSYMVKNAIARNFLRQANSFEDLQTSLPYFQEGEKLILSLINEREEFQVKAFSTHCYLYEKLNFLRKFKIQPTNQELKDLFNMLKLIIDKTPEDGMTKHISNHFYKYLKDSRKTNIIDINFYDLSKYKIMFEEYNIDFKNIFEDFELE